jgi:hypothetical protein
VQVATVGDVNGDGFADVMFSSPNDDTGGTGATFLVFGGRSNLTALDLADGSVDGHATLAAISSTTGFKIFGEGSANTGYAGSFGSAGDVNGDGIEDIIVGGLWATSNGQAGAGATYVIYGGAAKLGALDAADGALDGQLHLDHLTTATGFRMGGKAETDWSGSAASSAGDVNGDGFDDILVGAHGYDSKGRMQSGAVFVVYGGPENLTALDLLDGVADDRMQLHLLDGTTGFRLDGANISDFTGSSVSAAGDVNGDGFADLLIGANGASPDGIGGAGVGYIVYGGNFSGAVTHLGDAADNILTGTGKAETFIGGGGNDTISGGGGADSIDAGVGADQIHVSDRTFHRVDGGGGQDVLHLDFSGAIDFGNIDATAGTSDRGRIANVEVVDVDNGGANALTLHLADVLDIDAGNLNVGGKATLDNVLKIEGNSGDTLHLVASEGWGAADTSTLAGYAIYSIQHVQVAVDTQIAVTVS